MSTLTIPSKSLLKRVKTKRTAEPNYITLLPPGEILAEKLDEMGVSAETLAQRMGLPFETIRKIIRAKIKVTPEIAELLERETQIPVYNWLRHEECFRDTFNRVKKGLFPNRYITYCNVCSKQYK